MKESKTAYLMGGTFLGAAFGGFLAWTISLPPGAAPFRLAGLVPAALAGALLGALWGGRLLEVRATRLRDGRLRARSPAAGPERFGDLAHRMLAVLWDTDDAVALQDPDGKILAWNRGAEQVYGYGEKEAVGMNIREMIPETFRAGAEDVAERLRRGERVASLETRRRTRHGEEIDVRVSFSPVVDETGKVLAIVTTERDVSERKQARQALERSEKNLRHILESSMTAICIHQQGRVVYKNPAYDELMGPLPGLFVLTDYAHICPEDAGAARSFYQRLSTGEAETDDLDFRFWPVDGSGGRLGMKWVHCRCTRTLYNGREGLLFNFVDITNSRELTTLLSRQEKMSSLGRVAATITHEIRNALSSTNLYLHALEKMYERKGDAGREKEIIEQIKKSSNQIESVVRMVKDFSKPGNPRLEPCDINRPLEGAVDLCSRTLRKSGIRIEKVPGQGLPPCRLDPAQIERVIVNLVLNAADALLDGGRDGGRIEAVSFEVGGNVAVRVSDNGPGVPAHARETIFEPFFSTRSDGTGIGLTLCQRIIKDHGGLIYVRDSGLGGAEFVIELPAETGVEA